MAYADLTSGKGFTRALGFIVAAAVFANTAYHVSWILREPDLWWHIRSGQVMLSTLQVPITDTFSFTHEGQPWIAKEWLSQVFFALTYNWVGWAGPLLLASTAIAATALLFYLSAARSLQPFYAAALTLVMVFLVQGVTVARPHILTFPLAVGMTVILFDAARRKAPPPVWTLLLTLIWSNLHGSFPIAFVIAGCAFIDFLERTRLADRAGAIRWLAYLVFSVLVTVVNPYFVKPYLVAFGLAGGLDVMKEISEWAAFTIPQDRIAELALLAVLAVLLKARARFTLGQIAFVILTMNMMFTYMRFIYVFFLLVPIALLPDLVEALPQLSWHNWSKRQRDKLEQFADRQVGLIGALCAVAVMGYATLLVSTRAVLPPEDVAVSKALDYVRSNRDSSPALQKQAFNDYNFGGPLILSGIKTYIDGRSDQLFMGQFVRNYLDSGDPHGQEQLLAILSNPQIGWTIFPPADPRNATFAQQPGWVKGYADDAAVIYQRQ